MTHLIVWRFERETVVQEAACDDTECIYRYGCPLECDVYYDVRREPSGEVTHKQWDDDERQIIHRHRMHKLDYCILVETLNADPGVLPEMNDGAESFEIGRTPVEPVWQGEDGALWKLAAASTVPGSDR